MSKTREQVIVKVSVIGVIVNIGLSAVKAFAGLAASSIAVVLDAVNNLSDALSSIITIIGTKLAGKPADRKHPFGHGRIEYLTSMIIAVIILYAGVTALFESVKKMIHPTLPEYDSLTIFVVSVSVAVKILLGLFVKHMGKKVRSDSLKASGQDALFDSVISMATLVAAVVYMVFKISLEACLGALISLFIIKAGIEMIKEGASAILGERIESAFAKDIKHTVVQCDSQIQGAFDLFLNNYGPDRLLGSVHIEVPSTWTADKIDDVTRKIQKEVYMKHGVTLTGIGIYSINTENERVCAIRTRIARIVMEHPHILGLHGFYINEAEKTISFDVIVSFDARDMKGLWRHVTDDVRKEFPEYTVNVAMDTDISD